ncbi:hypothetical protein MLD38_014671 [Melastoma candidum]|uniref:Uncharacterized protein n=1 Tax=Melastoma candidum TaxID=119954 RepID=A0ACB9RGM5_9MYRT|nr:hypothetical protein MLD38_014671 [Melastoma candidum]
MGSGQFPDAQFGNACYTYNLLERWPNMMILYPEWVGVQSEEKFCYNSKNIWKGIDASTNDITKDISRAAIDSTRFRIHLLSRAFWARQWQAHKAEAENGWSHVEAISYSSTNTRHAIKSILSEDGDVMDCVDMYKQPAFDHPALMDHKLQMAPSDHLPVETSSLSEEPGSGKQGITVSQLWQRSGSCPKGTVPIRRSWKGEGRKFRNIRDDWDTKDSKAVNQQLPNHSMAILFAVGYNYNGAKGDIKVCNPYVEKDDEWSKSQIALKNGPSDNFESVEAGWAVNPGIYGDKQTRFFVYWTVDGSNKTGCFDHTCPGFIQTSHEIALGAAIRPVSFPGGLPYQITVYIYKDVMTNNWWVQYGEKINVGYWPAELFRVLTMTVESVEWGGEVYSTRVEGVSPHTSTQMGNGNFPDYLMDGSGWVKRMRIRDNSMTLKFPETANTFTNEFRCYNVFYLSDYIEDPELYYGGPGKNALCP